MSMSMICVCPNCRHEFLFKSIAKRPRPHCPKCSHWFYAQIIPTPNTQKESKKEKEPAIIIKKFESLDEKTIENLILDLLNEQPTENRIKLAVDFHNKIRGTDAINMEEGLNMEGFLQHELHEREKESNQSIHEAT